MFISRKNYDELSARNVELARKVRNLSLENKQIRELKEEAQKNNRFLAKEISRQAELLTEIADRSVCCPLDNEKIVLNKIKELARDYQSNN